MIKIQRGWRRVGMLALAIACACIGAASANPYGIAGTGVLTKLGMPSGCSEYSWDTLQPANPINMVRPCKYWVSIGQTHKFWGYHESTESIDNPTQFASWVTAYPGKTWIIGNEPDLGPQDGLTVEQYARMFHCYYTFIKALDPAAKFAIGAVTGGSIASALTYTQNWYQQTLNTYKTLYGTDMPIDVWNVHSYAGATQIEDPDKIINEFVNPFVAWCHTVQSGAYVSCPVWITECPVGEWMGATSPENTVWFMQHYLPRLEQTAIEKWFWYVSVDWDGRQGSCALTRDGQVTPVGAAYAALANNYPNPIPEIPTFVPYPTPEYTLFDFSGEFATPWFNKGGWWSNSDGELRHTGIYPFPNTTCCPLYVYQDLGLGFRMKINTASADINWAGVLLRASHRLHCNSNSGYLFFVRRNGEAAIYDHWNGVVASMPGAVADPTVYHDYHVNVTGFRVEVYIDGVKKLDWTDSNFHYASGYVVAQVLGVDASYDTFVLSTTPWPVPVVADDGAYTLDLEHVRASWSLADTRQTGYEYAVGSASGLADVVPWTPTTDIGAEASAALVPGAVYYFNVRAVYSGGAVGPVGSSDGITAVAGPLSIRELKSLAPGTLSKIGDKVVSGVFSDGFYIQDSTRSSGIKVLGALGVEMGDLVTLIGMPILSGQEALLSDPTIVSAAPGDAPSPLLMSNTATGGGAVGLQPATVDSAGPPVKLGTGLSPVGLLVRTTGKVAYVDPLDGYAYLDDGSGLLDGSGHTGVRYALAFSPIPAVGAQAQITGCLGALDIGGNCARYVRPRALEDTSYSSVANWLKNSGFEQSAYDPWVYAGEGGALRTGVWNSVSAHTGSWFFGAYGAKVCYCGYLRQRVVVPAGDYRASLWSVIFHPFTADPEITKNRIGIDPTGGSDASSGNVVWSEWDTTTVTSITPWHQISTPTVSVSGGPCTVFLEYVQQDATRYHLNCFDDVVLEAAW